MFPHTVDYKNSILFRGFDDTFMVPQSRHTTFKTEDIQEVPQLKILASSKETGVYAVSAIQRGKADFYNRSFRIRREHIGRGAVRSKIRDFRTALYPRGYHPSALEKPLNKRFFAYKVFFRRTCQRKNVNAA